MKLSFVGLGSMGQAMAESLLSAGHALVVYNRTPERADPLREQGARVARSPREAAAAGEIVLSMLADDAAVEAVTFGADGLLAGLALGSVHVSCSTISVALAERLAEAHAAADRGYVAATVFGRPVAARTQKLWVLAAGPAPDLERVPRCDTLG